MPFRLGIPFSDLSAPVVDTTPPGIPTNLAVDPSSITTTGFTLTCTAPSDPDLAGFNVLRGGTFFKTFKGTTPTFVITGLPAGDTSSWSVTAWDSVKPRGNESQPSSSIVVSCTPPADVTAPSVPTGLVPVSVTSTSATLQWGASTDTESGVGHYTIKNNGVIVRDNITGTSATISGLTPATPYSYTVSATDLASPPNTSAESSVCQVTTSPAAQSSFADNGGAVNGASSTTSTTLTLPVQEAIAAGSTVLASVAYAGGTAGLVVSDSKGNTWNVDAEAPNNAASGGKMVAAVARGTIAVALGTSDTVSFSAPSAAIAVKAEAFAGVTASPVDKTSTSATSGSSITTGAATTTQAAELAWSAIALLSTNNYTPDTGQTLVGTALSTGGASQRYVAATMQQLSATGSVAGTGVQKLVSGGTLVVNNYAAALVTYKITTSTGGTPPSLAANGSPVVSGVTQQGSVLTCTTGQWNGSPTDFSFQWMQAPSTKATGTGATSSNYTEAANDVGKQLYCNVTASNNYGKTTAASNTTAVVQPLSGSNVSATLVPKNGAWFGTSAAQSIDTVEAAIFQGARKFDVAYSYEGLSQPSDVFAKAQHATGHFVNLSLEARSGETYRQIAAGQHNAKIDQWGKLIAALPYPVFITPLHEGDSKLNKGAKAIAAGNPNSAPSQVVDGSTAADYKAAFRLIVDRMRAAGATNAIFVLCFAGPTSATSGSGQFCDAMYPGQGYVDWVTTDPYHAAPGGGTLPPANQTAAQTWAPSINFVQNAARPWHTHGVAYGLTETGTNVASEAAALGYSGQGYDDASNAAWFKSWSAGVAAFNPPLKMITLFDYSKAGDVYCAVERDAALCASIAASPGRDATFSQPHS